MYSSNYGSTICQDPKKRNNPLFLLITLSALADLVGGTVHGDPDLPIEGVSVIRPGQPGTITFLNSRKYNRYAKHTQASAIITAQENILESKNGILVSNPRLAMTIILAQFSPKDKQHYGIHSTAVISSQAVLGEMVSIGPFVVIEKKAHIGDNTSIGAHSFIGQGARVGKNTVLDARVHLYHHCQIGESGKIMAGVVVGADGFGFVTEDDVHHKLPQIGKVIIGNNVEMGANCTVDRGTVSDTVVGDGCKFDNGVHIAHNVILGQGCLLTAHVVIAGSVEIGEFCVFGGQSGVTDHISIGDRAMFAAKSGITKSLPGGKIYAGMPAREIKEKNKRDAVHQEVKILKKQLAELEHKFEVMP